MKPNRSISAKLNKSTKRLRLILGDQLNASHSWFKQKDAATVYLIAELKQEACYTRHHIQKICAFFAAMGQFAYALAQGGHQVIYLTLDETAQYQTLTALLEAVIKAHDIDTLEYQQPDEFRLHQQLQNFKCASLSINQVGTEHFLLPFADIASAFKKDQHVKMEFFYRRMRKHHNILMDDDQPRGGKWNFDAQNRNRFKKNDLSKIPKPLLFANDVKAILRRLEEYDIATIGAPAEQLLWPINRQQSQQLLGYFCRSLLAHFGTFQDAMTANSPYLWSLYHARISFALNSKMIAPMEVIAAVLDYWKTRQSKIDIAQIEGFVRQILGWREYVRGIYWANMPEYGFKNKLNAKRRLPAYFWTGNTKMKCMQQTINQSLEFAYAHHIQRLMVTGNFCLLTGIDPDAVDQWYLGIYIDAIEWVEMPNTRGMAQFADGGIVATKPYAASGSYINKMSDYCKSCYYNVKHKTEDKACPLNSLYWYFVQRHQDKFKQNGRMNMVYNSWRKMDQRNQNALIEKAETLLANLESL